MSRKSFFAAVATGALLVFAPVAAQAHKDHKPAVVDPTEPHAEPVGSAGVSPRPPATAEAPAMAGPEAMPERLYDWLGRWHPSLVHFPIAFLLAAAGLEGLGLAWRRPVAPEATRVMIALAAIAAVGAAGLGWLAMGVNIASDDAIHAAHRWLGTALAVAALVAWACKEAARRRPTGPRTWLYAAVLTTTVVGVVVNGYLGGALVHGPGHLAY